MNPTLLWSMLTDAEQGILQARLLTALSDHFANPAHEELAGRFCEILLDEDERASGDETNISARLLTLRNFLKQTGAEESGSLWDLVSSIQGVRSSYLEILVRDRDQLLGLLRTQGYVINREPFWSIHRFDSARAVTDFSDEPSLHFANDRAEESGYGANYFFVHWDVTSVWFRMVRPGKRFFSRFKLIERLRCALKHRSGFADPESVESYLATL